MKQKSTRFLEESVSFKSFIPLLGLIIVSNTIAAENNNARRPVNNSTLICNTCNEDPPNGGNTGEETPAISILQANIKSQNEHTFELLLSNGVYFVVDDVLNKIFIANSIEIQEVDLNAALLASTNNNQALANTLRQKFHATLTDSTREMLLLGNNYDPNHLMSLTGSKYPASNERNIMSGPGSNNPYLCWYEYYCYWQTVSDFNSLGWGGYGFGFLAEGGSGVHGTPDWNYWNRWRQDKCDAAKTNVRNMGISAVTVAATCPAAEAIAPIVLCAAAGASLISELDNWADNSVACNSYYPGPGNW